MSAIVTESTACLPDSAEADSCPLRRQAFYVQSQGEPLLTWLHTRDDAPLLNHAVVLCAPVGYEQLHSYRTLRRLADALAQAGLPVVRFDWHGTGDSAGLDDDPQRCSTWQSNLRDTVDWVRHELRCQHVSLVGLRLGATIAAVTSSELNVEQLVLWAPVTNGRAFAREMMAIDMTSEYQPRIRPAAGSDTEAAGFTLTPASAADLSQWNLVKSTTVCRRALLVTRDDLPDDPRLQNHFESLRIEVEQVAVPGYLDMMAEPHRSKVPLDAIQQITAWLKNRVEAELPGHLSWLPQCAGNHEVVIRHRRETSAGESGPSLKEQAVRLSTDPDLFGIVSEPAESNSSVRPTIVLLNAGSSHRVGPGRLSVHLAREMAARGFRCLRLDIHGLGDSVASGTAQENETYPETVFRDVDLALNYLLREHGVTHCILMGLCSGAYGAFQSAARLSNPMIVESILINPLTFFWKTGMTLETSPVKDLRHQHYYLRSALDPKKWLKLLSGKSRIGLGGALRVLARRLAGSKPSKPLSVAGDQVQASAIVSHPEKDDLPADLVRITRAGRKLAMFFATSDPGYSILMHKAKSQANSMRQAGQLEISFIKDADHTFSRRQARSELSDALVRYLSERYRS